MRTLAIVHALCAGWSGRGVFIAIADEQSADVAAFVAIVFCFNLVLAIVRVREVTP